MIRRWISLVPSKMMNLIEVRAVTAGRWPDRQALVSTNSAGSISAPVRRPRARQRQLASNLRRYGCRSVVLHQTEFVALGIRHDDDHTLGVVVSFTGELSSQRGNELDGLLDLIDGDIEMNADLAHLRLGNRLKHQSRLGIAAMAKINPAVLRRPRLATEQGTPKTRHPLRINAVEGHARDNVRHLRHPTTAPRASRRCPPAPVRCGPATRCGGERRGRQSHHGAARGKSTVTRPRRWLRDPGLGRSPGGSAITS